MPIEQHRHGGSGALPAVGNNHGRGAVMQGESRVVQKAGGIVARSRGVALALAVALAGVLLGPQLAHAQRASPPNITLTADTQMLKPGDSAALTAKIKSQSARIARVVFYDGSSQLAIVAAEPYTLKFTPSVLGVHNIKAVAVDTLLQQGTSNVVSINVTATGNAPPTVSLAASRAQINYGTPTMLTATPADSDGWIRSVTFMSNGIALGTVTAKPWQLAFTPSAVGSYSITAVATDNQGASTTSAPVVVDAINNGRGNTPPSIALATSTAAITVGETATLTATASDVDGTVTKVEFYNGFVLAATDTTSPYTYGFTPTSAGTYTLTAKAYDDRGSSTASNGVTITVTGAPVPPTATLPKIALALSNTLFAPGGTLDLTGTPTAGTGATIMRVSFYQNGQLLDSRTVSPYRVSTTLANPGTYDYYAVVVDSLGQSQSTLVQRAVVQNAPPVVTTDADIWRLLNQATFGASQAEAARVKALGITGWINDQITKPASGYPDSKYNRIQLGASPECTNTMPDGKTAYPADSPQARCVRDHLTLAMVQRDFFTNAVSGSDQLRQRVAWALSQILVVSANKPDLGYAHAMARYQNLMFEEAFGNYEALLRKVTYNPAMGNYLDMVNNDRAPQQPTTSTRVPNENYAREVMQLFSINLEELDDDGTPLLDAQGKPVPTYGQSDIGEFAKVFTGYTYGAADNAPATGKRSGSARYYAVPMVSYPTTNTTGHEPGEKHLLNGTILSAGQTAQVDIDAAIRNIFLHPNTPVYIGKQLIQKLVTGNPSPAYVKRVVQVFKNNGSGVRGDLAAVVKAILLDPEARGAAKTASDFGSLREPVQVVTGLIRALNGITDGARLEGATNGLGQRPYYSPSVFNYFMPDAKIPGTTVLGPEFGIHTTVTAIGRANLVYDFVYGSGSYNPDSTIPEATGTKLFLAPFEALADQPAAMVSLVNQYLAGGQFPAALEPTIVTAVNAIALSATPTAAQRLERARMAVYLMASSYDYQVQR